MAGRTSQTRRPAAVRAERASEGLVGLRRTWSAARIGWGGGDVPAVKRAALLVVDDIQIQLPARPLERLHQGSMQGARFSHTVVPPQ